MSLIDVDFVKKCLREEVVKEMNVMIAKKKVHSGVKDSTDEVMSIKTEDFIMSQNFDTVMTHVFQRYTDKITSKLEIEEGKELSKLIEQQKDEVLSMSVEERKQVVIQSKIELQNEKQKRKSRFHNVAKPILPSAKEQENMRQTVRQVLEDAGIHIEDEMISDAYRIPSR